MRVYIRKATIDNRHASLTAIDCRHKKRSSL